MDFALARRNMVESQIRPNGVTDSQVLDAMGDLPREAFVPPERQGIAYIDHDLPLGNGRAMLAPMVLAKLLQAAAVQPGDLALVVGCATGYSVAVLSRLAGSVVGLDSDPNLLAQAGQILADRHIDSVVLVEGPLRQGWPKTGPYNVILFDGAVGDIPAAIVDQLADGGRLLAPMAAARPSAPATATLVTRVGTHLGRRDLFEAGAPLLKDFIPEPSFSF